MPIHFQPPEVTKYFSTIWKATVTNAEMVAAYRDFLAEDLLGAVYCEFADFSEADISTITIEGLRELSDVISEYCAKKGISDAKCASYIPGKINHGLLELYDYLSNQSPEKTRIFTSKKLAISWLLE